MKKSMFLSLAVPSLVFASPTEEKKSDSESIRYTYVKVGTELGLGMRTHQRHGFDFSVNLSTIVLSSWFGAKALYLNYPFYSQRKFFYWGVGAGITHEETSRLLAGEHPTGTYPTIESVIGYEFNSQKNRKYFVQFEASVPLAKHTCLPVVPAIVFGIGF